MTAPVTDQSWPDMYRPSGRRKNFPVASGVSLKQYPLGMVQADGYLASADAGAGNQGSKLAGPVIEEVDNASGSDGDKEAVCDIGGAEVKLVNNVNLDQSNVGDNVSILNNRACLSSGATHVSIGEGTITEVISGTAFGGVECWVQLKPWSAG